MRWLHIVGLAVAAECTLAAGQVTVCLENAVRLDAMTVQAFRGELKSILAASALPVGFAECGSGAVRIRLRGAPPAAETTALGAARYQDGKVLPELEIYVDGIARLLETRLPGVLGRAMARVATHEMAHYLFQTGEHQSEGVLRERLSAAHLLAGDSRRFRLTPRGSR